MNSSDSGDKKALEVMLKEYEMLRQEIVTSMQTRSSILTFAFTTIGVIFAASITAGSTTKLLSNLVLIFGVPSIAAFSLFQWLGEYERMQRAGKFIIKIENKVNNITKIETMSWETHLASNRQHMSYPYNSTVFGMVIISLIGVGLGLFTTTLETQDKWCYFLFSTFLHGIVYFWTMNRIKVVRSSI